jgi:8-amino-7-oxononanoate synthase
MSYLNAAAQKLEAIKSANRYREITGEEPPYSADFSTNDYLALSTDSRMVEALRFVKRTGSGGARLLGGGHREHVLLEQDIAGWLGRERALVFSSGYLAALGVIQVLSGFVETIYSDTLNHACLIDGIRASGKPREIFPHGALPPRAQRKTPALIVTESLFGMDGTVADLNAYANDLNEGDILLVDEAHALGVFGPEGAGFARALTDPRIVVLGTLGKAIGTAGGFIAGPAALVELLINTARTFVFDTAPPPGLAFASRVGIMLARSADDRRVRLFANAAYLRDALKAAKIVVPELETPIVPIVLGSEEAALKAMRAARKRRVNAPAIRPPTVPADSSRLRISVRADHSREHFDMLMDALACTVTS